MAIDIRNVFLDRIDSMINTFTGLGGSKDKGNAVSVDTTRVGLDPRSLESLGRHEGYAVSWLDRTANESVLTGWYVQDLENRSRYHEIEKKETDLRVRENVWIASRAAAQDGASLVLMVTKRAGGGRRRLSEPLGKDEEIVALHAFDKAEFEAHSHDGDFESGNFRNPSKWTITPVMGGGDPGHRDQRRRGLASIQEELQNGVHWTRVLYFHGRPLTPRQKFHNRSIDGSVFDPVWDAMKDQRQIDQGGAVLAQEMQQSILKVEGLEKLDESAAADALLTRMKTLAQGKGLLGTLLMRAGDEYIQRSVNASGFKDLKNAVQATWAAVTRQPQTVAYGATPGGLNTDGEAGRKAWDRELVLGTQELRLRGPLTYLYGIMLRSVPDAPARWKLKFNDLGTLTLKERADVQKTNVEHDKMLISAGIATAEWIAANRYSDDGYVYELPPIPAGIARQTQISVMPPQTHRAIIEVQTQVAKGGMSVEAGTANLRIALGVSQEDAIALIADHGTTFTVEPEEVVPAPPATETTQDQPGAAE